MWDEDFGRRLRSAPLHSTSLSETALQHAEDTAVKETHVPQAQTQAQALGQQSSKRRTQVSSRTIAPLQSRPRRSRSRSSSSSSSRSRSRSWATSLSPTKKTQSLDSIPKEIKGAVTRSMARKLEQQETSAATEPQQPPEEPTLQQPESHDPEEDMPRSLASYMRRSSQFNYDRFIPTHTSDLRPFEHKLPAASPAFSRAPITAHPNSAQIDEANRTYDALLRSELLNDRSSHSDFNSAQRMRASSPPPSRRPTSRRDLIGLSPRLLPSLVPWSGGTSGGSSSRPGTPPSSPPILAFRSPRKATLASTGTPTTGRIFAHAPSAHDVYRLSSVSSAAQRILKQQPKPRIISPDPIKVLDASGISDDFYLNLIDWSASDHLAVALGSAVVIWDARTSDAKHLCDTGIDTVTSVRWGDNGRQLAIGLHSGIVQLWDPTSARLLRTFTAHSRRVGTLDWNGPVVSSGSRDRRIHNHDSRMRQGALVSTYHGHTAEVCGLRWSPHCSRQLASGGNDNLVLLWDTRYTPLDARVHARHPEIAPVAGVFRRPLFRLDAHTAAVKALAWSPTQPGLLASGGGTSDCCIRMWNTTTGTPVSLHKTDSQVCNLCWAPDGSELVSTHGYVNNHVV
ncbi:substrate-specific activator of APC-dependent proteolysis, partial [Kickxella alabastrina]